jgi:hypothetical protein
VHHPKFLPIIFSKLIVIAMATQIALIVLLFSLKLSAFSTNSKYVSFHTSSFTLDCKTRLETETENKLEELFTSIENTDPKDVSESVRNTIEDSLRRSAPSDNEVRMQMLGITPLTKAGFILAAFLIFCNTLLGYGWLGNLIGLDDSYSNRGKASNFESNVGLSLPASSNSQRIEIPTLRLDAQENLLK